MVKTMSEDNDKYDEENISEEFEDMKKSFKEFKNDLKKGFEEMKREISSSRDDYDEFDDEIDYKPPRPRRPRKPRPKGYSFHFEPGFERLGESIEYYFGSVMDSLGDSLERSLGGIFNLDSPSHRRGKKKRSRKEIVPLDDKEFYDKGPKILSALSDPTRLEFLKILESGPKRQSELSEKTDVKGGNFRHHIEKLIENHFVTQEGERKRYMITYSGREALKLVEFLYIRSKRRIGVPIITDDEEESSEVKGSKIDIEEDE